MSFKYSYNTIVYSGEEYLQQIKRLSKYGYEGIELVGEPDWYDFKEELDKEIKFPRTRNIFMRILQYLPTVLFVKYNKKIFQYNHGSIPGLESTIILVKNFLESNKKYINLNLNERNDEVRSDSKEDKGSKKSNNEGKSADNKPSKKANSNSGSESSTKKQGSGSTAA